MQATRTCGNGEPVLFEMTGGAAGTSTAAAAPANTASPEAASPAAAPALPVKPDAGAPFIKGSSGAGLRGIDASASAPVPTP